MKDLIVESCIERWAMVLDLLNATATVNKFVQESSWGDLVVLVTIKTMNICCEVSHFGPHIKSRTTKFLHF